ncbi:hypothetical protein [Absidia glauca]|uniref:Bacterial low temperature requirement A protein-domain-containing protein n=1 Tax=Absidia glauca TaxID=4829 RepID=A0A163J419_ABSGL|nr:hypothetical protein [Absidia glauca]
MNAQEEEEEEFIALNHSLGGSHDFDDDHVEMTPIDIEKDPTTYHHGNETFGDVLTHPMEELQAHRKRKEEYEGRQRKIKSGDFVALESGPKEEFILVVHFRQLRGNQGFAMDHEKADQFAKKASSTPPHIGLTQKQRIEFNGVRDTDGLTAFLYKSKCEFSIKIHHKAEPRHSSSIDHLDTHDPSHDIIDFNDNVYVEFKPKHHHHEDAAMELSRRPFFRYPEPDLSADIGEEKAASWLELFYDLFYVATLSQFTHTHVIKDWNTLGTYASWFIITWWAWISSSLYTARFDTDDVVHHIWKLIEMCSVIGMAGSSDHFLNSRGYVYGYIALKSVLVIEYTIVFAVAVMIRSKSRLPLGFYIGANLVSIALWGGSLLILEKEIHRFMWYLGLVAEILVNIIVRGDKTLSWAASHLAERLGLLTLIVLGENLMSLVPFVATSGTATLIMIPNFMAVTIIFGFFFMYFEDFNKEVFLHNKYHQVWVYLHFPLHLLQVAFGISLIDTLKVYKQQMEAEGKLPKMEVAGAHGSPPGAAHETPPTAPSTHGSSSEHGATTSATHESPPTASGAHAPSSEHGATHESPSSGTHGATSTHEPSPAAAHKLAKRAIEAIHPPDNNAYNPMKITLQAQPHRPSMYAGYLTWGKYATQYLLVSVMGATTQQHQLVRRSATGEEAAGLSDQEKIFVYKTFLIFGGGIIVVNSFIKLLNTKISDLNGKLIIGSRVLAACVLWSLCAVPFAQLDAIILLAVMLGALVLLDKDNDSNKEKGVV